MAIAHIRNQIKDLHKRLQQVDGKGGARDMASKRFRTRVTIHNQNFSHAMTIAINDAAVREGFQKNFTNERDVRLATWDTIAKWSKGNFSGNLAKYGGVSCETTSYGAEVVREAPDQKNTAFLRIVNQEFRKDVLENWKRMFAKELPIGYDGGMGKTTGFSHDESTNVATAGLVDWIESLEPGIVPINTQYTNTNIAKRVLDSLEIKWEQEVNPQTGKMEWVIQGELGGINPDPGDRDLTLEWENRIIRELDKILADDDLAFYDPMFVASKPFTEVMTEETVRDIVKPYKRLKDAKGRFVKMTGVPKKNKKSTRKGKGRPRKKTKKQAPKTLRITAAAATSMRREKGANRATDDGAIQLAKLKKYINSRLPAEVRRNMGRPALINQTGRFSNSVQLMSLMEGKNTLMAKYTYLLAPYETFENTGKKRWPLAYNPKTLIAKSIRNLAQGRIEQKLTLRRV